MGTLLLYRFAKNGHLIDTIGKAGRGPGEYDFPYDFYVDENSDNLYIQSSPDVSLYRYHKNGTFIHKKTATELQGASCTRIGDYFWIYCEHHNNKQEKVAKTDRILQLIDTLRSVKDVPFMINSGPLFTQWSGQTFLHEPLSSTISELDADTLREVFFFDFGSYNVSESFWTDSNPISAFENLQAKGFINSRAFFRQGPPYYYRIQQSKGGCNET